MDKNGQSYGFPINFYVKKSQESFILDKVRKDKGDKIIYLPETVVPLTPSPGPQKFYQSTAFISSVSAATLLGIGLLAKKKYTGNYFGNKGLKKNEELGE